MEVCQGQEGHTVLPIFGKFHYDNDPCPVYELILMPIMMFWTSFQQKVSLEVERDLYEYVSFMDAATLEFQKNTPQKGGPGHYKSKKRGRGRPAFPSPTVPATTENPNAESTSKADDNDTFRQHSEQDDGQQPVSIDHDEPSTRDGDENDAMDVAENQEDQRQKDQEMDLDVDQDDNKAEESLIIKPSHPLMGVWQGSFAVKTLKGKPVVSISSYFSIANHYFDFCRRRANQRDVVLLHHLGSRSQ